MSEGQSPPLCETGSKTHWVLGHSSFFLPHSAACGILVPQRGLEPTPPAAEMQSLNHLPGTSPSTTLLMFPVLQDTKNIPVKSLFCKLTGHHPQSRYQGRQPGNLHKETAESENTEPCLQRCCVGSGQMIGRMREMCSSVCCLQKVTMLPRPYLTTGWIEVGFKVQH